MPSKNVTASIHPDFIFIHFSFVAGLRFWNSLNLQHMSCTAKRKCQLVVFLLGLGEFQGRCCLCSLIVADT